MKTKNNRIKLRWEVIRNGMGGKKSENITSAGTWDEKCLLTV